MNISDNGKDAPPTPAELQAMLGPPLVLSTESEAHFNKVFDQLIAAVKPQDMVEAILIRDFAVASWEINRYTRQRTLSLERGFKQNLEFQAQRIKSHRARQQGLATNLAEHMSRGPADIAHLTRLEEKVEDLPDEVAEILSRTPSELDHSHALEKTVAFHKDVEFLIVSLTKRRNEALHMLELYRAGLGKHVDKEMAEIVEGEYRVVEESAQAMDSPPLIPSTNP